MTKRILIVEDETIVAMDLAATLRRLDYEVVGMFGTAEAAIDAAAELLPDLILMDIRLKGAMDGIEAATRIQQQRRTAIIFLTAHADAETVEQAQGAAPYAYLVKPFDERTLHRVVEITLQRAATETAFHEETLDALWRSEERFRLLVDGIRDYAMFVLDLDGRIATWNAGAKRPTGFTEEEVVGQSASILRPADSASPLDDVLARVGAEGSAEWEAVGVRKNGSRYAALTYCATLLDRAGTHLGYVAIIRDVSDQRSLQSQLAQAQKLESLGQLAGGVAHDFNNMLMVIFARCDMLMRRLKDEQDRQFVHDIRAAARKNRDLTQQLLAAARQQVLEPQVVNLNDIVATAIRLLAPTLGEQLAIRTELDDRLWNVHADPGKLHQVLVNLAINARDAMPDGGTLTIETRNVHAGAAYVSQHLGMRQGDYVSLVVTDTGTGIPRELRARVFDPFFTTKAPGRGTGLGLAVVHGIVEQTGGRIWMYSEEGRGTAFKILLPRNARDVSPDSAAAEETIDARGTETILLVEDEELLRAVIQETLREQGYRVLEARTSAEAMAISGATSDRIDLLLTDMIMPGVTGAELANELVATRPELRVVFMSGYTSQSVLNQSGLPPSVRYLEKPVPTPLLLRTVRAALDE